MKSSSLTFFLLDKIHKIKCIRHNYNTVELYNASPMGASVNCFRLHHIKYYKVKNKARSIKKTKERVAKWNISTNNLSSLFVCFLERFAVNPPSPFCWVIYTKIEFGQGLIKIMFAENIPTLNLRKSFFQYFPNGRGVNSLSPILSPKRCVARIVPSRDPTQQPCGTQLLMLWI